MKNAFYTLLIILLFGACQNVERSEKPRNLIAEDKMVEVLTEVSLLNSARNFNKRLFEKTGITPEEYIYEKFNIDSLQFEHSNNYYSENYSRYEKIYLEVKENLQNMKKKLDSIRNEEIRIQDSISEHTIEIDSLRIDSLVIDSPAVDSLEVEGIDFENMLFLDSIGDPATIKEPPF